MTGAARTKSEQQRSAAPAERFLNEMRSALTGRRGEIEKAMLKRVVAIDEPSATADPTYAEGLRKAVSIALDYWLATINSTDPRDPPLPLPLLSQARFAARYGVEVDIVLRRCFAGHACLGAFLVEEVENAGRLPEELLRRLLRSQNDHFDRLISAMAEEHGREARLRLPAAAARQVALVRALLAGEAVSTDELPYDLELWHVGLVSSSRKAPRLIRAAALEQNLRYLLVEPSEATVWGWLGSRERPNLKAIVDLLKPGDPEGWTIAVGEPVRSLEGWRLTHQQAAAALPIGLREDLRVVRYADVALIASLLRDETATNSLQLLYIDPWSRQRDADALRGTLEAYFEAEQNVSSAAARLGVKRHTVTNRLRRVEQQIDRSLSECSLEMAAAIRLSILAA